MSRLFVFLALTLTCWGVSIGTASAHNSIARTSRTRAVPHIASKRFNLRFQPYGIVVATDGTIFVDEYPKDQFFVPAVLGTLSGGTLTEKRLPIDTFDGQMTQGPDGNIYITEPFGQTPELATYDPLTKAVDQITITGFPSKDQPAAYQSYGAFATDAGGTLWSIGIQALRGRGNQCYLAGLPPSGPVQLIDWIGARNETCDPGGLVVGSDGRLWWPYDGQRHAVSSIWAATPSGTVSHYSLPVTGARHAFITRTPYDIVSGSDGNLWVASSLNENGNFVGCEVDRVTTAGVITTYALGQGAVACNGPLIEDKAGYLWVPFYGPAGVRYIARIDQSANMTYFVLPKGKGGYIGETSVQSALDAAGNMYFLSANVYAGNEDGAIIEVTPVD